jgi:hypothetical protein
MDEIKTLNKILESEFGKRGIEATPVPELITSNLNQNFEIRPYQERAFQYFLNYWTEKFDGKPAKSQLLFHMATGSGKTYEVPFYFRDNFKQEINLAGYTARMQVRPSVESDIVTIELTTSNGRISIDEPNGIVVLFISDADTAALDPGSYKYDLELISGSGRVYCPVQGSFKVKAEVTRA